MKHLTWMTTLALFAIAFAPAASADTAALLIRAPADDWCGGQADANCYYCSHNNSENASNVGSCDEEAENYDPDYQKTLCGVWDGVYDKCRVGGGVLHADINGDDAVLL